MHQRKFALAMLAAAVLAGCGGNGSKGGDQTVKIKFSSQVVFGDSLSDVGSYAVGTVKQLGGGKFTINGDNTASNAELTGKNWTELMAAQLGLPAPCAAQTGLNGDVNKGFAVAVVNHAGCFGYAQGGSRVTNPVGPGNALSGSPLGALTVPVSTQIANHLAAVGGKFKGDEIVFVTVGGNDTSAQLGLLQAGAAKAGASAGKTAFATTLAGLLAAGAGNPAAAGPLIGLAIQTEAAKPGATDTSIVGAAAAAAFAQGNASAADSVYVGTQAAKAKAAATAAGTQAGLDYAAANGPAAIAAMATAGTETAELVKTQIVAKGANYVVVNNLPDFGGAPVGKSQSAATQALIVAMVDAYNAKLKAALAGEAKVLHVDLYAISHDQINNPEPYGLTNTRTAACGPNPLDSSLGCTGKNVIAGDVSRYMFADDRHPTPFEYSLIARYVAEQMIVRGWM
ncbi:SGNH/GDSL hydrolase family protein [Janthinobacterium fluminis]|uniref:SGNH/GDSL hydrolase family protein n=1 Tax=Janthinobacterium fluminis TaxID=2987524 RepID=A0ABT5K3S5_9BURK|nr:SGNH/GDSL hydrolase family protein [Janthinobacterium fluminis]MDC8759632.1 SGNH/GDSL hydrolase family protein [Janthinobacterium fluminis]